MMNPAISKLFTFQNIITDIGILAAIYFIPAASHSIGVPLYYMDPMRFFLLAGLFLSQNKNNAILMAISIPMFSWLIASHPIFPKAILISIELVINVLIVTELIRNKKISHFAALLLSIGASKLLYYAIRFIFVQAGIMADEITFTEIYMQLINTLILSIVCYFLFRKSMDSETLNL